MDTIALPPHTLNERMCLLGSRVYGMKQEKKENEQNGGKDKKMHTLFASPTLIYSTLTL